MTHKPNFNILRIDELGPTTIENFTNSEDDGVGRDIAYLGLEVMISADNDGVRVCISPDKDIAAVQIQRLIEVLEDNNYHRMAATLKLGRIFAKALS